MSTAGLQPQAIYQEVEILSGISCNSFYLTIDPINVATGFNNPNYDYSMDIS